MKYEIYSVIIVETVHWWLNNIPANRRLLLVDRWESSKHSIRPSLVEELTIVTVRVASSSWALTPDNCDSVTRSSSREISLPLPRSLMLRAYSTAAVPDPMYKRLLQLSSDCWTVQTKCTLSSRHTVLNPSTELCMTGWASVDTAIYRYSTKST